MATKQLISHMYLNVLIHFFLSFIGKCLSFKEIQDLFRNSGIRPQVATFGALIGEIHTLLDNPKSDMKGPCSIIF